MKTIISLIIILSCSNLVLAEEQSDFATLDVGYAQIEGSVDYPDFNLDEIAARNIDWDWWKTQVNNVIGAGLFASYGAKMLLKYVAPVVATDLIDWVKANVPSIEAANYLFSTLYSAYQSTTKWTSDKVLELSASIVDSLAKKYLMPALSSAAKSAFDTTLRVLLIR